MAGLAINDPMHHTCRQGAYKTGPLPYFYSSSCQFEAERCGSAPLMYIIVTVHHTQHTEQHGADG